MAGQEDTATDLAPVLARTEVISEGKLVPKGSAQLAFVTGGLVTASLVDEGDEAAAGQVLARLDDDAQRAAIAQAEAAVAVAQAELARVKAGPRPEDVAAAETGVALAEANLSVSRRQVESAKSAITLAEGQIAQAQANLSDLWAGATEPELEIARRKVALARNDLWAAQAVRDGVAGAKDRGQAQDYDVDQAEAAVGSAYEAWEIAQQDLARIEAGARPGALAAARAGLEIAEAQKAQAERQLAVAEEQVGVAQASVAQAEAQVTLAQASARQQDVERAEAAVAQAEAALQAARVPLTQTELIAPFAGTVASLDAEVGEQVGPGQTVVQLADFTPWYVETDDLTEIEVVRVQVGQAVTLVPDALPDLELQGVVESIRQISEIKRGDTTYTVRIRVEGEADPRLRWGMTILATFE
ncbi:MAG: HlyD family efflux transporter periplasmic adaptor subunit [Anaerolineae bacterium]|nr:HlyD family efflux transporter periplasmic adaptor subunit [Anaerolineae bacterium]